MRMTMSMTINELQEKWRNISPYTGGFLLVSGEHPLSFHIGYYGERMCFIVLDAEMTEKIESSKAISASCVQTEDHKFALQFLLNNDSLNELFIKLCWDLIECSKQSFTPVDDIIARFNGWMRLLQKKGEGLLSPSIQKGLIGELLFLKEAIKIYGAAKAVNAWVGPEGSDQDYIFEDGWFEIKSTTIASATIVISSLQQLDRKDDGILVVYFMDKTTTHGSQTLSLPEVIEDVEKALNDANKIDILSCKLAKYGYFSKDADRYKDIRYKFAEKHQYKVAQDFPRLIRNNVSIAIHNAKYELALSSIEEYKIL